MPPTVIGAGEQGVLTTQGDPAHGAFDGVGVQFQTPVTQDGYQSLPVVQRVTDRLGQSGTAGDASPYPLRKSASNRSRQRSRLFSRIAAIIERWRSWRSSTFMDKARTIARAMPASS